MAIFSEYLLRYSGSPSAILRAEDAPMRESRPLVLWARLCNPLLPSKLPRVSYFSISAAEASVLADASLWAISWLSCSAVGSSTRSLAASAAALSLIACSSSGVSFSVYSRPSLIAIYFSKSIAFLTARIYSFVGSGVSSSPCGICSSLVDSTLTDLGLISILLFGLFFWITD